MPKESTGRAEWNETRHSEYPDDEFLAACLNHAKLQHLERLATLGSVSANVAHEIKNALVGVKTFVHLLAEKNPDAELRELATRELVRIERLVTQLLKLSSPQKPRFVETDAHEALDNAVVLVGSRAAECAIVIQKHFNAALSKVYGDGTQLQQAFINILLNGIEAVGRDGQLILTTENTAGVDGGRGAFKVLIRDTGPGIPAENIERLFDGFFTTKPNGTGLGLPITRRIIQQHGGTLTVLSTVGEGAAFEIVVPLR
jgi:signal transduction histidine kinase